MSRPLQRLLLLNLLSMLDDVLHLLLKVLLYIHGVGSPQSPAFINGVLDAVWKKISRDDFDLALFQKNATTSDESTELKEDF